MLAGDRSRDKAKTKPRRGQSCEHCRESRNFPNYVHWHVFYFTRGVSGSLPVFFNKENT